MIGLHLSETLRLLDVVDLTVCCKIYKVCNGNQFEIMRGSEFVDFLNLKPLSRPVQIRFREKSRVCFLFHCISREFMNETLGKEWILQMLKRCNIEPNYYKSHYKDAESAGAAEENTAFVQAVKNAIFEAKSML